MKQTNGIPTALFDLLFLMLFLFLHESITKTEPLYQDKAMKIPRSSDTKIELNRQIPTLCIFSITEQGPSGQFVHGSKAQEFQGYQNLRVILNQTKSVQLKLPRDLQWEKTLDLFRFGLSDLEQVIPIIETRKD